MVATPRIAQDDPKQRGLLFDTEQFEVIATLDRKEWAHVRVQHANLTTFDDKVLQFWHVVDNVWHLIWALPEGWYGPVRIVNKDDEQFEAPEEAFKVEVDSEFEAELERDHCTADLREPRPPAEVEPELVFDTIAGPVTPPRKLKDIWQGKGDPYDLGPDNDVDIYARRSPAEQAALDAAEEAKLDDLRAADDAVLDENRGIPLPQHLGEYPEEPHYKRVENDAAPYRVEPGMSLRDVLDGIVEDWHGKATGSS